MNGLSINERIIGRKLAAQMLVLQDLVAAPNCTDRVFGLIGAARDQVAQRIKALTDDYSEDRDEVVTAFAVEHLEVLKAERVEEAQNMKRARRRALAEMEVDLASNAI